MAPDQIWLVSCLTLVPLGVLSFALLHLRMRAAEVRDPPVGLLFAEFAAYGAVLLIGISAALGIWSAGHSLATVLLVFAASWLLPWRALRTAPQRRQSKYHALALALGAAFPLVLLAMFGLAYWLE